MNNLSVLPIPGLLRRRGVMAVLIGTMPASEVLTATLSAANVPTIVIPDTSDKYAVGSTLDDINDNKTTIWDKGRRQLLIVGDVRSAKLIKLCLTTRASNFEVFVCSNFSDNNPYVSIAAQRLLNAGVHPIGFDYVLDELSQSEN